MRIIKLKSINKFFALFLFVFWSWGTAAQSSDLVTENLPFDLLATVSVKGCRGKLTDLKFPPFQVLLQTSSACSMKLSKNGGPGRHIKVGTSILVSAHLKKTLDNELNLVANIYANAFTGNGHPGPTTTKEITLFAQDLATIGLGNGQIRHIQSCDDLQPTYDPSMKRTKSVMSYFEIEVLFSRAPSH